MIFIDLTQTRCPETFVKAKLAMKQLALGEQLHLKVSDFRVGQDVHQFAKNNCYECHFAENGTTMQVLIIKRNS